MIFFPSTFLDHTHHIQSPFTMPFRSYLSLLSLSASLTLNALVVFASQSDEITLESFQTGGQSHIWKEMNDPVMGGKSTGSFHVNGTSSLGVFQGKVVNVPFLHAPGFIQARTTDNKPFPDVSSCAAFKLTVRSLSEYAGYRFSFGDAHPPNGKFYAYGYKITLENVPMHDFGEMILQFDEFTDFWDDATGDPIVTCHKDSTYCPTEMALRNLKTVAIWAEGVAGDVSLEIQSISAVGCASPSMSTRVLREGKTTLLGGWKKQQLLTAWLPDFLF
jgi:hypothetical protein